ncbi:MFS transporter permease [Nocardioides sp. Root1257]|uniref:MFS transporter n=1 Tax=unclassified Nocardioides TaxID=2615069 RepID=UPI0006F4EE1A|nr:MULTISPECIES: MFS transporter [unclassified Nocardioides]KQW47080.1 MFS transporter permease [Nocardioides sp. Root1257]KRC43825.1 MFS transporter permease [Nocardioides sp. Root224]
MTDTVKTANDADPLVEQDRSSALMTVIFLCFAGMSVALMQTLVIPIQSELPQFLGTSAANASWVVTITLLGAAVAMPIAGRLGDLFGKQRVLVGSSVLMLAGSLVCALSDTLVPVIAGRGLQGLAMGFIPVGISLMREVVPPAMATTAVAAMSATLGVGGAIGLPLSAWIVQTGDWHTLFWVATGLAVLVGLGSWFLVPHVHDGHPGTFDFGGALGLTVGLVTTLVGITKGNTWGWGSPRTVGAIVVGVLVLLAWGWYELRRTEPLCDLRVTSRRPVLLTNIAALAIGFGMMAQAIVFPQLLQLPEATGYGLGQSVLAAGLWMAPSGLMMLALAPFASWLMRTFGAKYALALGAAVLGGGYLLSFFLMSAPWQILIATLICGAGVGIGYAAMPTLIMNAVPMNEAGSAVGINALMRSVGTTVASAVMATVLTGQTSALGIPTEGAFKACFLVATFAAFLGGAVALTIPRSEQA